MSQVNLIPETIPLVPFAAQEDTKKKKKISEKLSNVIYLGHIPHGFYEDQMREYFTQFGEITNLRLSRNKKTGASKHFAFIEFKDAEVTEIVANTMDNYLFFTSVLKCHQLPVSKIHPNLWKGSNRRFVVPKKRRIDSFVSAEQMEKRKNRRLKRYAKRRAHCISSGLSLSTDDEE